MRGYLQYLSKWFILTKHFIQYSIQFRFVMVFGFQCELMLLDFESLKNKEDERTEAWCPTVLMLWRGDGSCRQPG